MPINSNFNAGSIDPARIAQEQTPSSKMYQQAIANGAAAGADAANQRAALQQKAAIEDDQQNKKITNLKQLLGGKIDTGLKDKKGNPIFKDVSGRAINVDGVSVGADTASMNAGKESVAEMNKLQSNWDKLAKGHKSTLDRYEMAYKGLASGNSLGVKQAVVNLAGTTEGNGQRILQSVIHEFGGDPSIAGGGAQLDAFINGLDKTGKSDAFMRSLRKALDNGYASAKSNFAADRAEFLMGAPNIAPHAASNPGFNDMIKNYGTSLDSRIGSIDSTISDMDKAQAAAPAQAQPSSAPGSSLLDKIKGFPGSFFGGTPAPQAAPAPAAPQAPASGLDAAIQQEIARRRGGK